MYVGEIFKPDGVIFVHCPNCIFSTFNLEERITFETKKIWFQSRKNSNLYFFLRFEANPSN
jgi:hypothetical protein